MLFHNSDYYYEKGRKFQSEFKLEEAIENYSKAIQRDSNFIYAYNNRGICYYRLGEFRKAIYDFNAALKLNPMKANTISNRGECYRILGEYEKAFADFNESIKIEPRNDFALGNRGFLYLIQKEYDKALTDFNMAIKINPNNYKYFLHRSNTFYEIAKFEESLKDLNIACQKIEGMSEELFANLMPIIFYNRGRTYYALKEYNKAIPDWKHLLVFSKLVEANRSDYDDFIRDKVDFEELNRKIEELEKLIK